MSQLVRLVCDVCGRRSRQTAGRVQDLRPLPGWTAGYAHHIYAGQRADYCPACSRERAKLVPATATGGR